DDVITLRASDGRLARLPPMALTTIVEESAHVHRFQIVQDAPDRLQLRLERGSGKAAAWAAASAGLRTDLAEAMLPTLPVVLATEAPIADPRSGKLRAVIVALRGGQGPSRQHS